MTVIYAWPPLRNQTTLWSHEIPVRRSRGAFSGRNYASSAGAVRRTVQVSVSARAGYRDGAGLCESLNLLLDGGINLVRFPLPVLNWHRDVWAPPFDLEGEASLGTVTTSGGFDAIALSGLVPGEVVCRAFDLIGSYDEGELAAVARAVSTVIAAIDGTAVIKLHTALPAGVIRIGESETGVFDVISMTPGAQAVRGDWSYAWALREVLAEEIDEEATEVDPWG